MKLSSINVVILCGGLGQRLRPVIGESPKPMAKVHREPFLDVLLKYLRDQGFQRAVLCAGYKGDVVEEYYRSHDLGMKIDVSLEKSPLETGGAIKHARQLIESDPFVVVNGDSFCPINYSTFVEFHSAKNALASMVIVQVKDQRDYGLVVLKDNKEILKFQEKSDLTPKDKGMFWINAGIYLFNQDIFTKFPAQEKFGLEYDVFPKLVNQKFYGFEVKENFIDIGTPERFKMAQSFLKERL